MSIATDHKVDGAFELKISRLQHSVYYNGAGIFSIAFRSDQIEVLLQTLCVVLITTVAPVCLFVVRLQHNTVT